MCVVHACICASKNPGQWRRQVSSLCWPSLGGPSVMRVCASRWEGDGEWSCYEDARIADPDHRSPRMRQDESLKSLPMSPFCSHASCCYLCLSALQSLFMDVSAQILRCKRWPSHKIPYSSQPPFLSTLNSTSFVGPWI